MSAKLKKRTQINEKNTYKSFLAINDSSSLSLWIIWKPININNKEALDNFLNQHTQNSIDEQLQKQLAQLEKEAQIQKELREKLLEEEIRRRADPAYQALLAEQEAKKHNA